MSAVASVSARQGQTPHRTKRSDRAPDYLRDVLDLDDFERAARPKLPHAVYGYVAHGSETETTLRANRAAFSSLLRCSGPPNKPTFTAYRPSVTIRKEPPRLRKPAAQKSATTWLQYWPCTRQSRWALARL